MVSEQRLTHRCSNWLTCCERQSLEDKYVRKKVRLNNCASERGWSVCASEREFVSGLVSERLTVTE